MPIVTETEVTALAFCVDGQCLGYAQESVPALRRTSEFTYRELGGDLPGVEKSTTDVQFVNDEDAVCALCGKPRLISEQERPEYANVSGQDPEGIFKYKGQAEGQVRDILRDQELKDARRDTENAELRALIAQQNAAIERMTGHLERQAAQVEELQARPRGPGRPRRVQGEDE